MERPKKRYLLGKTAELEEKGWKTYRAGGKDLIVAKTDGGLKGYVNFCTHMGGKVRCIGKKFFCDWHGAEFTCETGEAEPGTAAPEGTALKAVTLETEEDDLYAIIEEEKSPWSADPWEF